VTRTGTHPAAPGPSGSSSSLPQAEAQRRADLGLGVPAS
jgi:hypothetical protein